MIPYRVVRSGRKTIAIQVGPDGTVTVRAPLRVSDRALAALTEQRRDWIEKTVEKQKRRAAENPPPTAAEIEALRRRAKAELPPKVEKYAAVMGVAPTGVRITSAKTRFGSCSGKNSLSFSCLLLRYPEAAVDYVVVHELAHIRHHDHSAAFWAEVEKYLPDYRARRALLRQPPTQEE